MQQKMDDKADHAASGTPVAEAGTTQASASFGQTLKAVFWSFLGIRKRRDHDQQTAKLNPLHVVIAALLGVGIFIFILLMIVKSVVAK